MSLCEIKKNLIFIMIMMEIKDKSFLNHIVFLNAYILNIYSLIADKYFHLFFFYKSLIIEIICHIFHFLYFLLIKEKKNISIEI